MLWRPVAFFYAVGLGTGATVALWVYLVVAHDVNRVFQTVALFGTFGLGWFVAWKYLAGARSLRGVQARFKRSLKMGVGGGVALVVASMLGPVIGDDATPSTLLSCADCDAIAVTRVIDGDTLVSGTRRIRLYGIDAPEVGQRCAAGATNRLKELAGETVRIEPGPRSQDVYGRALAYLYTEDGDSIDELLVSEGHAVAWTRDGQHKEFLVNQEAAARLNGVGCIW